MAYDLTIEPLGEVVQVEEGQSLLDACLRRGIYLPHACTHGRCSTCKVKVLRGDVAVGPASDFALMDFERENGVRLACVATCSSDAVIEADVEEDEDAEGFPVVDRLGTVVAIEALTPDIRGIVMELDEPLEFQAGQYVNVHVPGLDRPRAFSIASPPSQERRIELQVKRVPDGPGTTWLHDELKVGDQLKVSGPYGQFFVRYSAERPMIFVAGGSGISAIQSMILEMVEEGLEEPVTLVYGARDVADLHGADRWRRLAEEEEDFTFIPVLSRCTDDGWCDATGYAHDAMNEVFEGRFSGHKAYLCGPPPMIDACITTLMQGRLFDRDIHLETFITEANAESLSKSPLFKRF